MENLGRRVGVAGVQHGVEYSRHTLGHELLYTRNAVDAHVLGNLYGISAPGSYHFFSGANVLAGQPFAGRKRHGSAEEPLQTFDIGS